MPLLNPVDQIRCVPPGSHFAQVYDSNELLVDCLFAFFEQGFSAGEIALVIATRPHRSALEEKFAQEGYDVSELKKTGKYVAFDAAETLGMFMNEGRPEEFRFNAL